MNTSADSAGGRAGGLPSGRRLWTAFAVLAAVAAAMYGSVVYRIAVYGP